MEYGIPGIFWIIVIIAAVLHICMIVWFYELRENSKTQTKLLNEFVVPVVPKGQLELPIKIVLPNAFTFLQLYSTHQSITANAAFQNVDILFTATTSI